VELILHHLAGFNDAMLNSAQALKKDIDVLFRQQAD
jgi:hypothetical protein